MRAIIYTRVSQDAAGGRSVNEQEKECRLVCERNDWHVHAVYSDNDIGASRWSGKDRPAFAQLQQELRAGDILVTWEPSRVGRDMDTYVQLRKLCADLGVLWSYSGNLFDLTKGEDRFRTGLDFLMAENEAEKTRERVLRSIRANVSEGKPHGKIPIGYIIVHDEKGTRRVPHPEHAPFIREAARRVIAGETLYSIMLDWRKRNVQFPALHERTFYSNFRQILVRPTYAGFRTHKGKIVGPGTWEPIIPVEEWEQLCKILKDPARRTRTGDSAPKHLLSFIAECGVCGSPVHHNRRSDKGNIERYYCGKPSRCVSRSKPLCDAVVTEILLDQMSDPAMFAPIEGDGTDYQAAQRELEELNQRLEELADEVAEGNMSAKTAGAIEQKLTLKIADAERRARAVNRHPIVEQFMAGDAREVWERLDMAEKRFVVRTFFRVRILPTTKKRDPASIEVTPRRPSVEDAATLS